MCCKCSEECNKTKLSFWHNDPDKFDRSQWCPPGRVSTTYFLYRVFMAGFMIAGVVGHMVNSWPNQGWKWFIYMTDQGILLLMVHYVLDAIIVSIRFFSEVTTKESASKSRMPFIYQVSWCLGSCFFTIAIWISIVYWTVLHKFVVENDILKNDWAVVLNVFLHAINTVSCLIDIFIQNRPWHILHFYAAVIYGLSYTVFSVIYWAAGGVGICKKPDDCMAKVLEDLRTTTTPPVECPEECDKFIYPILDWEDHPGLAIGIIFGGCLFIPLLHAIWYGLYRLRLKLFEKFGRYHEGRQVRQSVSVISIRAVADDSKL